MTTVSGRQRASMPMIAAALAAWLLGPPSATAGPGDDSGRGKREAKTRAAVREETVAVAPDQGIQEAYQRYERGCLYMTQDMAREALAAFDEAIALSSPYPKASYMRGAAQFRLGLFEEAAGSAREALAGNPMLTEAHNLLGLALAETADREGAARAFRTVLQDRSFPTPEVAHFNIGRLARLDGDCIVAEAEFQRAIELNTRFGKAWYLLGECLRSRGDRAGARAALQRAAELLPEACEPALALAGTCLDLGDTACARAQRRPILLRCTSTPMEQEARRLVALIDAAPDR